MKGFQPDAQMAYLKSGSCFPKMFTLFVSMKALYEWWKMLFISSRKLYSFFRYLRFCHFFGHVRKRLDEECKVRFKSLDATSWEQTIAIYKLPIISRSKNSPTMKFIQLTECNMKYIFLQKSCRKRDRETSLRSFFINIRKNKWSAS